MRPLSLLWIALLLCAVNLSAQTTWTGATDTDWFNAINWSSGLPSATNPAIIPAAPTGGNFPTISMATTINYNVDNFGELDIAAPVTLQSSLGNLGPTGVLTISTAGTLDVGAGGVLDNFFRTINFGNIIIGSGTINNFGRLDNYNSLINNANFVSVLGSILNNGTPGNRATIENNSIFTVGGTINIVRGLIINNTSFNLQASGSIDNNDQIKNNSNFYIGGGALTNDGTFTNCGSLTNDFGANFTNNGTLENSTCSYVNHFTANALSLGTVVNNGVTYAFGSGITIDSGTGENFTNPFTEFPAPSAYCFNSITIHLNQAGNTQATITAADLDSASVAPYCGVEALVASQTMFSCADIGTTPVTLIVTDTLGFSSSCVTNVIVHDISAPAIIFCPPNQTINIGPSLCGIVATYPDVLGTDNCGSETILRLDTTRLNPGDFFPLGTTNLLYAVTDGLLSDTCSFSITVNEFQPVNNTLTCQSFGKLSIDLDCVSELQASMLLLGEYGCFDIFETSIIETGETTITSAHVGQTITVMVRDPRTGNSCWGDLFIEDRAGPAPLNCVNDTIFCMENPLPFIELGDVISPTFQDCSGDIEITYYDNVEQFDCSANFVRKITRNWLATDVNDNTNRCTQEILVKTVDLTAVLPVCPSDFSEECVISQNHSLDPEVTGYPTVTVGGNTFSLDNTADFICNVKATFRDDTLATSCGASLKIIRTWKIIDCCASNTILWTCS